MSISNLAKRKKCEQEQETKLLAALACRKRQHAVWKEEKRHKRKSVDDLLPLLAIGDIRGHTLRDAQDYVSRSYNLDRQIIGLLNHLFVQYPVPAFLYEVCLTENQPKKGRTPKDKFASMNDVYRQWFVTLAQGGSFPKAVRGIMTSKEASVFLKAPAYRTVHENVWWARMTVASIPDALIGPLIDRIFTNHFFDDRDGRLAEAIQFYARYHASLSRDALEEVTDFVAWKLQNDRAFRMKGRTAASVLKLSNEWHLLMQRAKLGRHIQWEGLRLKDWEFEAKSEVWQVIQLRNNKDLMNEGRKQKHCVYSYVQRCINGHSFIFSMRACRKSASGYDTEGKPIWDRTFETRRVTIEVNAFRSLVQVRGPLNRAPIPEELDVLRRWTGETGLHMASKA